MATPNQANDVRVTSLTVRHFRSYEQARITLDAGVPAVVLAGDNGMGKTNVLEALSFLAPGRGMRRAGLTEVRRQQSMEQARWSVAATIEIGDTSHQVGTGEDPSGTSKRVVRIDGQTLSQSEALGENWAMVWLTPQMDRLFQEGPSARRRFLDRLVLGLHPGHGRQVSAYERAMRERNRLLSDGKFDASWCSAIEARMAEHATAIATARVDYAGQLAGQLADNLTPEAFPEALIALDGEAESLTLDGLKPADVEQALKDRWAANRSAERAAGRTLSGPHKTDMKVTHAGKNMDAEFCSTGEQKSLLVSLILANSRLIAAITGRKPILLLDEVVAHLDTHRRQALFDALLALGCQVWLTGTDAEIFSGLGDKAQIWTVADGTIRAAA